MGSLSSTSLASTGRGAAKPPPPPGATSVAQDLAALAPAGTRQGALWIPTAQSLPVGSKRPREAPVAVESSIARAVSDKRPRPLAVAEGPPTQSERAAPPSHTLGPAAALPAIEAAAPRRQRSRPALLIHPAAGPPPAEDHPRTGRASRSASRPPAPLSIQRVVPQPSSPVRETSAPAARRMYSPRREQSLPPFAIPPAFFSGLGTSSAASYVEAVTRFREFVADRGNAFPLPITSTLIADFITFMVDVRNRSSSSVPTWKAALSRLADSVPGCAAEHTPVMLRVLKRASRAIAVSHPVASVGKEFLPSAVLRRVLTRLASSPSTEDRQFRVRLLTLLNTGARAGETNAATLTLDNVFVRARSDGEIDYIRINIMFSKTRKTLAEPLYKYLFPRSDFLDAVGPFVRFLRARHGFSVPPPSYGREPVRVSTEPLPLFPLAAGKAGNDTSAVTAQLRAAMSAAGVADADLRLYGSHSCRATLTTLLFMADVKLRRIQELMGWGSADMQSYGATLRYIREPGSRTSWRRANVKLAELLTDDFDEAECF